MTTISLNILYLDFCINKLMFPSKQELLTKMNEENFHSSVTTTLSCNSNPSVAVYPVSNPRLPQSMQEIIDGMVTFLILSF